MRRYDLWLDSASRLPVKVVSRGTNDDVIETVVMDGLQVSPRLADELFNP